jgi:Fur family zinc uptake transcriptional regulator
MYNARDTRSGPIMQELPTPFPTAQHDHDDCVDNAMLAAEELCRDRGLRFTTLRRRVLSLVWESHKPVGAYEILASLSDEGRNAAPPTVYRALGFLIEAGLVHRLNMLNAFIGCPEPTRAHSGQFLICRECRTVAELDDVAIDSLVNEKARALGFTAVHQVLEIEGTCSACRAENESA